MRTAFNVFSLLARVLSKDMLVYNGNCIDVLRLNATTQGTQVESVL